MSDVSVRSPPDSAGAIEAGAPDSGIPNGEAGRRPVETSRRICARGQICRAWHRSCKSGTWLSAGRRPSVRRLLMSNSRRLAQKATRDRQESTFSKGVRRNMVSIRAKPAFANAKSTGVTGNPPILILRMEQAAEWPTMSANRYFAPPFNGRLRILSGLVDPPTGFPRPLMRHSCPYG